MKRKKPAAPRFSAVRYARPAAFALVLAAAVFVGFFNLGVPNWGPDELVYRQAGLEYVRDGYFGTNLQQPLLVKYFLGISQVVFGSEGTFVVRLPSAVAALLTGLVMFVFARRVAGFWTGLLALGLWTISPLTTEFGRVAIMEVFVALFATLALYLGWRWAEGGNPAFAALAGVSIGLATASKPTGIPFLPAVLLIGALKVRPLHRAALGGAFMGLATAATALATYWPIRDWAVLAMQRMFEYRSIQGARGWPVTVAGELYHHAPWWSHLWWQWNFWGTLATASLAAAVVIAALRRRTLDLYLLSAVLVPVLFLSFSPSTIKLSYYYGNWQAPLILLLALAVGRLVRWRPVRRPAAGWVAAGVLLFPFVLAGAEAVREVSTLRLGGHALVAEYLRGHGYGRDTILVWGNTNAVEAVLPDARVVWEPSEAPPGDVIEAVVVDSSSKRFPNRGAEGFLEEHEKDFELRRINRIQVYVRE